MNDEKIVEDVLNKTSQQIGKKWDIDKDILSRNNLWWQIAIKNSLKDALKKQRKDIIKLIKEQFLLDKGIKKIISRLNY